MYTIKLLIMAVGGQGNLLASSILGEAALLSNISIRMSQIHGMSQRGGVVESSIVFGEAKSTIISNGEADILVGFEPVETLRALNKCNVDTVVITNLAPLTPFTVNIGQEIYPDLKKLQDVIRAKTSRLIAFDATGIARKAGNGLAVNMVLMGALIQTGILPIGTKSIQEAIRLKTKPQFLESNLRAFDLGFSESIKSGQRDGLICPAYSVDNESVKTNDGFAVSEIESNIGPYSPQLQFKPRNS